MKRIAYIAAFAAAGIMVSCQKDAVNEAASYRATFTATIESGEEAKASIGEKAETGFPILWSENDSISVMTTGDDQINTKLVLSGGEGSAAASFDGDCGVTADTYYAVYPYDSANKMGKIGSSDAVYIHWDGAEQTACPGTCDPSKIAMVACGKPDDSGKVNLAFKNVLAYVKFYINHPCKTVTLETNTSNFPIACSSFRVGSVSESSTPVLYPAVDDGSSTITLKAADDGIIEYGTYYIAVLPTYMTEGFSLTFTSPYDETVTYVKSTDKSVSLSRNTILNLGNIDLVSFARFSGTGTSADPYLIKCPAEMELMADKVNSDASYCSACYKLANDLDCNGAVMKTIGRGLNYPGQGYGTFFGEFDGNGHTIRNYIAGKSDYLTAALFGYIAGATIKDLNIEVSGISEFDGSATMTERMYSPLVGCAMGDYKHETWAWSVISGCHVKKYAAGSDNSITVNSNAYNPICGGILGVSEGQVKIIRCENELSLNLNATCTGSGTSDYACAAGIVGSIRPTFGNGKSEIDRCRNTGDMTVTSAMSSAIAAGILCYDYDHGTDDVNTYITNCVNKGNMSAVNNNDDYAYAGGMIGYHDSDGDSDYAAPYILNCLNTGNMHSKGNDAYAGGLMGYCYEPLIQETTRIANCASTGSVSAEGDPYVGALCGSEGGEYSYCYWIADLPITYGSDDKTGKINPVLSTFMTPKPSKNLPAREFSVLFCGWDGTSADGSLDLDYKTIYPEI